MNSLIRFSACWLLILITASHSYDQLDSLTDNLLRDVMSRMGGPEGALAVNFDDYPNLPSNSAPPQPEPRSFEARRDAILGREPSIRDQEYLQHSSLYGKQSVQGGAGEGYQRLKPDGSMKNVKIVKTDAALPAYCQPPNPCPLGYIADDGCLEQFENTAAFSREYQRSQDCMCDSEHMFDCPGATRESEIDALARSFENEGLAESTLDRFFQDLEIRDGHKIVAKKFFSHKSSNPYLEGEKLPVIAKKAPKTSIM
ncbi:neuroendocrine protein 7B2-like isoform X1 [Argiope bruennichi]|uniref:Neuroendocrine protein 7B2 n=1 Tax=Argiope bruennichi TaxID=94029 RepID=A0A8T0F6M8_ARGBR|nr:neuroendocrine protein 7B2-like isoform X1 [Argiope bruennichi]KAF8785079.1 Neuroendocrine protein 7B2 like protein [Argiope bruennichi]